MAVQHCWLGYTAALGLFFPITFTLRHIHASDMRHFRIHSSLFSLKLFVTSRHITLFITSRYITMLAVVISFFFASWPYSPVDSPCCCLSFLSYPFTSCSRQHLFLLCSTTINSCSQDFSPLILHWIQCQDLPSFLSPTQCNFISSQQYWFGVKDFSSSFFSSSTKLILPDARQIISWI